MSAHSFIATGEVSDATEVNRAWLSNPTWFTVYTYRPWVWLHHHPTSSTPTLTLAYITLTLFLFLLLILQLPFFALYVSSLWNSLPDSACGIPALLVHSVDLSLPPSIYLFNPWYVYLATVVFIHTLVTYCFVYGKSPNSIYLLSGFTLVLCLPSNTLHITN